MGKTTLSLHVASALARSKQRVLLIDADPQQSAMKWSTVRSGVVDFAVIGMAKATLHKEIVSLGANYDHVVIDGPPRVTEFARSIIIASDVVVMYAKPSPASRCRSWTPMSRNASALRRRWQAVKPCWIDTDPDGTAAREVISLVRELVNLHEQESELRRPPGHAVAGG